MILGIGSDLCDIRRIARSLERFGERFTHRIFTEGERAKSEARASRAESYARRFAAKEACAKALGTGMSEGVSWREMEVVNLPGGRPTLRLTGAARARLDAMTPPGHEAVIHVTLTDDPPMAQAFVVIEARPGPAGRATGPTGAGEAAPGGAVTLREVTAETVRAICALEPRPEQHDDVAANAVSIAEGHFAPAARFRAVYAGETPVGFAMWRPAEEAETRVLWRFMVDGRHQGRGYGRAALTALMAELGAEGVARLRLSCVAGEAGPRDFYRRLGFAETGASLPNGERVMERALDPPRAPRGASESPRP